MNPWWPQHPARYRGNPTCTDEDIPSAGELWPLIVPFLRVHTCGLTTISVGHATIYRPDTDENVGRVLRLDYLSNTCDDSEWLPFMIDWNGDKLQPIQHA